MKIFHDHFSRKYIAGPESEPGISDSSVSRATDCATALLFRQGKIALVIVGQELTVQTVGVDEGCVDIFLSLAYFSLSLVGVGEGGSIFTQHPNSKDSNHTRRMLRLTFAWRRCHFVGFVVSHSYFDSSFFLTVGCT